MSFSENDHPRREDGKFAPKRQQPVEVDLGAGAGSPSGIDIPAWDDLGAEISGSVTYNDDDWENKEFDSVLEVIGTSPGEAAIAYGPNRARWLAAVQMKVDVEESGWTDADGYRQDYEWNGAVNFNYIDPCTGHVVKVGRTTMNDSYELDEAPDFTDRCPFDENDELKRGDTLPHQFTEEGEAKIAQWTDAKVNVGHIRGWVDAKVTPEDAAHWQDVAFVAPYDYRDEKRKHKTPEAAVQASVLSVLRKLEKANRLQASIDRSQIRVLEAENQDSAKLRELRANQRRIESEMAGIQTDIAKVTKEYERLRKNT